MGSNQSKQVEVEVPRRSQNRLSKPRTNTSTLNLLSTNVPAAAASRRNSSSFVPLAASDKRTSFVAPEIIVDDSNANPVKSNLSTRRRLRDHLFRSKSSDGRSRGSSIVTQEELARDAAVDRWHHTETSNGQIRDDGQLRSVEIESKQSSSRPTSRRGSTAYTPYSHNASRLSLVVEAHTPEPNMKEASRRLEQLSEGTHTERSNSDTSTIPVRRRSILMTPGVATRRDSNGDILYETFSVSRCLSTTGTLGSRSSSWLDPSNQGLSSFVEDPVSSPRTYTTSYEDDYPRAVTPSEQAFSLGAYKLGSLRITNADSPKNDDEDHLSIKIPQKPLRLKTQLANGESNSKSPQSAQDPDSLSPFSFDHSRSPSPQLQTTSKNTAVEDELFEEEISSEIVIGSPEHALRILDGSADVNCPRPLVERSQTSPVRVPNSYASLNNTLQGQKEMPYKPLTKNDSGYSSNVSLRSFKAQAEARAAAANSSSEKETSEQASKQNNEALRTFKSPEVLHVLKSHPLSLASTNASTPLSENSVEQNMVVSSMTPSPSAESQKPWSFRPNLAISRKSSSSSPVETAQSPNSVSSKASVSLLRKLTKNRTASQPIIAVTSNRNVDSKLIPSVSASASAKLEEREKEYPTLSHTYKSTSKTNSMETLTTILSATDTVDPSVDQRSSIGFGKLAALGPAQLQNDRARVQLGHRSISTPADLTNLKPLHKPASKENQPQTDFETHITSFGTVSESLGASPYDLAVSAMNPRIRSKSFHHLATDYLGNPNPNRSHSYSDLAPHNTRSPQPAIRKGMSADTAVRLARQKSRDREIGHRMSAEGLVEKLRDDRNGLPSNKLATRASMTPSNSPVRTHHVQKRRSRTPPPPPVTMSPYRKSLLAQSRVSSGSVPVVSKPVATAPLQGPAASTNNGTYPKSGPWVPQRPQAMQRQSSGNAIRPNIEDRSNDIHRPSLENMRRSSASPRKQSYSNSYTPESSSYDRQASPQVLDRYSNGVGYGYDVAYGSSGTTRNTWMHGKRNIGIDRTLQYDGVDFSDVPVLRQSVRQEA